MPLVRSRALVLQSFPYSETSKILRLLTRDFGLRSVVAKGAQRPKSRFGGVLEPFTEGVAHFYLRDGRDLHTLAGFDLVLSRQALGSDLTAFAGASLLAELALRCTTEEPHPELFEALAAAWTALGAAAGAGGALEARVLAACWHAIALLGYEPLLERCLRCGRALGAGEPSRFDVEGGGAACVGCRPAGRLVDAVSRAELRDMTRGRAPESVHDRRLQRALLQAFLAAHLGNERPLRSLALLLQQFE